MNTRQKLTLGVAAIFMVTLTIVGVTYAYFVTKVTTNTVAEAEVKTATVGSIVYNSGNGTSDVVTLSNVLPGTTLYKSFSVTNEDTSAGQFEIYISQTDGTTKFVAPTSANTADCYATSTTQETTSCFGGTSYDNIYVTLYEVSSNDLVTDAGELATGKDLSSATTIFSEAQLTTADQTLKSASYDTIGGSATKYYVLKVEYKDAGKNQNIENKASISILASIK